MYICLVHTLRTLSLRAHYWLYSSLTCGCLTLMVLSNPAGRQASSESRMACTVVALRELVITSTCQAQTHQSEFDSHSLTHLLTHSLPPPPPLSLSHHSNGLSSAKLIHKLLLPVSFADH